MRITLAMQDHVLSSFSTGELLGETESANELARSVKQGITVVVCTYSRPASLSRFLDSLGEQDRKPDEVIIVDASQGPATEKALRANPAVDSIADGFYYYRVSGPLKGLTRQRNFALQRVAHDLVAFFDDDVVLPRNTLLEMEKAHRRFGDQVVGVGARVLNQCAKPSVVWYLRRLLYIISSLKPGTYCRSGISIPWSFLPQEESLVEGDWLPGCAMMWKTEIARELGFNEAFTGYSQGEDLEFSLRARMRGKLLLSNATYVDHRHDSSGRPDPFVQGYMAIYNRYQVHRRGIPNRTWLDALWFAYAWSLDSVLYCRHLLLPRRQRSTTKHLHGRLQAAYHILSGR